MRRPVLVALVGVVVLGSVGIAHARVHHISRGHHRYHGTRDGDGAPAVLVVPDGYGYGGYGRGPGYDDSAYGYYRF